MAFATSELTVSYDSLKMDDGKEARRLLEEQGIVIVSGVLSARECERAESGESGESGLGKFARDHHHRRGIVFAEGAAHLEPMWELRLNKRVQQTFANVLKCDVDELVVSLDRFNWDHGRASAASPSRPPRGWGDLKLHLDLNPFSPDGQSDEVFYQGVVTLSAGQNEWSAGTTGVCGSHKHFGEFDHSSFSSTDGDFCVLSKKGIDLLKRRGLHPHHLVAPRGSITIFSSRLVHCGRSAKDGSHRCAAYVTLARLRSVSAGRTLESMIPIPQKVIAMQFGRGTTHWVDGRVLTGSGNLELPPIAKTEEARMLAGALCRPPCEEAKRKRPDGDVGAAAGDARARAGAAALARASGRSDGTPGSSNELAIVLE